MVLAPKRRVPACRSLIRHQSNGFDNKISFGSTVSAAKRAINIAAPVNTPKMTVGVKLDIIKMENPKMTVRVV